MKKLIVFGIYILLISAMRISAEESKVVNQKNKYGGKTVEITFEKKDMEPKLAKKLVFYDSVGNKLKVVGFLLNNDSNTSKIFKGVENYNQAGKLTSVEVYFTDEKSKQTGCSKVITHFDQQALKTRVVTYYSESDFDEKTYSKSEEYFSASGERTRTEYYLADKEVKKTGFHKMVLFYEKGRVIKEEMYDKKGNIY
ncbi:hypothetical protein KKA14_02275 [bacterium]|nr:hypothetical protein [bacterium]